MGHAVRIRGSCPGWGGLWTSFLGSYRSRVDSGGQELDAGNPNDRFWLQNPYDHGGGVQRNSIILQLHFLLCCARIHIHAKWTVHSHMHSDQKHYEHGTPHASSMLGVNGPCNQVLRGHPVRRFLLLLPASARLHPGPSPTSSPFAASLHNITKRQNRPITIKEP